MIRSTIYVVLHMGVPLKAYIHPRDALEFIDEWTVLQGEDPPTIVKCDLYPPLTAAQRALQGCPDPEDRRSGAV